MICILSNTFAFLRIVSGNLGYMVNSGEFQLSIYHEFLLPPLSFVTPNFIYHLECDGTIS